MNLTIPGDLRRQVKRGEEIFGKPVAMNGSHMTGALNVPAIANRVELPAKKKLLEQWLPNNFLKKNFRKSL